MTDGTGERELPLLSFPLLSLLFHGLERGREREKSAGAASEEEEKGGGGGPPFGPWEGRKRERESFSRRSKQAALTAASATALLLLLLLFPRMPIQLRRWEGQKTRAGGGARVSGRRLAGERRSYRLQKHIISVRESPHLFLLIGSLPAPF